MSEGDSPQPALTKMFVRYIEMFASRYLWTILSMTHFYCRSKHTNEILQRHALPPRKKSSENRTSPSIGREIIVTEEKWVNSEHIKALSRRDSGGGSIWIANWSSIAHGWWKDSGIEEHANLLHRYRRILRYGNFNYHSALNYYSWVIIEITTYTTLFTFNDRT